jgi:hypothetical protein
MRAVAGLLLVALAAGTVHAQSADVPGLIKLIENQPSDMDRSTWKEKRRDAARKLAQSKDKRALPELAKLAETETFDIIGEIAIEGLGTLGDPGAVPTLQKIVADPQRDKGQRDLARKALYKLGASAEPPPPTNPAPPTNPVVTPPGNTPTEPSLTGPNHDVLSTDLHPETNVLPELPVMADDTLAAYERLTFAGGTANFAYDTLRKRFDFDADVAGTYNKRVEREKVAWGLDLAAHVVGGWIDPPGRALSRGAEVDITADGEARAYTGNLYGVGKAAFAMQTNYTANVDPNNPANDFKDTRTLADLEVAVGGGYGRLLDVGAAIRVRQLARALDHNHALGKPIDAATQKRLELTWWALRGERTSYRSLLATVAILREAGILLSEPDAGLTYEILNVLRDTQLYVRPSGFDIQVAFGEGYLRRPDGMNAMYPMNAESGRIEQLLAQAGYGAQLDDDKLEITGTGYARLRLFAPDMQPSPWAVGVAASMTRFTYAEHGDPIGAFDLTGSAQVSSDDLQMSDTSLRVTGELGFTYWLNQASGIRLAGQVAEDGGALFFGAALQASYGLLDGTFAR